MTGGIPGGGVGLARRIIYRLWELKPKEGQRPRPKRQGGHSLVGNLHREFLQKQKNIASYKGGNSAQNFHILKKPHEIKGFGAKWPFTNPSDFLNRSIDILTGLLYYLLVKSVS